MAFVHRSVKKSVFDELLNSPTKAESEFSNIIGTELPEEKEDRIHCNGHVSFQKYIG